MNTFIEVWLLPSILLKISQLQHCLTIY